MTRHTSPNIVQELKYDWQKCKGKNESWSSPISFKSFASLWFLLYPLCRKVICNHQNSTKVMSDICVFFRRFKGFSVFDFSVYDIITLVHVLWWLEAYDPFFQNWHFALNGLSWAFRWLLRAKPEEIIIRAVSMSWKLNSEIAPWPLPFFMLVS